MLGTALAVAGCVGVSAHDVRPTGQNCNLSDPPRDAGEEFNHGITLKIYPRARDIDKNYTGCQTVWMPDGRRWPTVGIVAIERGDPVRLWTEHENDPGRQACRYREGRVVQGDPEKCPVPEFLITKSLAPGCVARIAKAGGQFPPECEYE